MNIRLEGISKSYTLKTVLDDVDLEFAQGKIHALVGENGAGKSTLAGILSGETQPTKGNIFLDNEKVVFNTSKDAINKGICIVRQRPLVSESITVKENVLLGLNRKIVQKNISSLLSEWTVGLSENTLVKNLGGDGRFYTALLCALCRNPKVLILDEPTSMLDFTERDLLYKKLRELSNAGTNIIVITHSMKEARECTDTVTVLNQGKVLRYYEDSRKMTVSGQAGDDLPSESVGQQANVGQPELAGHASDDLWPTSAGQSTVMEQPINGGLANSLRQPAVVEQPTNCGHLKSEELSTVIELPTDQNIQTDCALSTSSSISFSNITYRPKDRSAIFDISFTVNAGEIVLIHGLQNSGLLTLENIITGMENERCESGQITIKYGKKIFAHDLSKKIFTANILRNKNILRTAIVSSNKTFRSSNPNISVQEMLTPYYFGKDVRLEAERLIEKSRINVVPEERVSNLSGGMLQKLILTRELNLDPSFIILCEPLQGLDVEKSKEMCALLQSLSKEGKAILVLSSEEFPHFICSKALVIEGGVLS